MKTTEAADSGSYVRLSCRVNSQIKQQAEQAATLLGQSITDFTEAALAEKAQSVLERHERIILSQRDFMRFVELVEKPDPPTPELRQAMADYQSLKATHPDAGL